MLPELNRPASEPAQLELELQLRQLLGSARSHWHTTNLAEDNKLSNPDTKRVASGWLASGSSHGQPANVPRGLPAGGAKLCLLWSRLATQCRHRPGLSIRVDGDSLLQARPRRVSAGELA